MNSRYLGLTWDHPRGRDALVEAARLANADGEALLHWHTQPLEGFESAPIAELARDNDLLVLDHPHLGEALAEDCLVPLEALYPVERLSAWSRACIGPALASYRFDGRTWALPLDVAAQVMARRADLAPEAPSDWDGVLRLAAERPVALSLGGPHAWLTLLSIAASESAAADGTGLTAPRGSELFPDETLAGALEVLHRLHERRPPGSESLNPIALLERMARSDEIALIPLVFGYVTYAASGNGRAPIAFSDAIGKRGVLGGTGIGFSRRATFSRPLLEHVASLLSDERQRGLIPRHGGQPSFRSAWNDEAVNRAANGFYRATAATAENAVLRPRFDGYITFQGAASERLRAALARREDPHATIGMLRTLWNEARERARGASDDERRAIVDAGELHPDESE